MGKQAHRGYPHKLRVGRGTPDQATEALLDAIQDNHPRMADEGRQEYRQRLLSIAIQLLHEAGGALLVRTGDTKELEA